jgi:hypothetical protein
MKLRVPRTRAALRWIGWFAALLNPLSPLPLSTAPVAPLPREIVLVRAEDVTRDSARRWKEEGFHAAAVVLDETSDTATRRRLAGHARRAGLGLHWWIEVARQPAMADAHPRWMASLGMHDDWLARFPGARAPRSNEVAKAWPWVPVWYEEAFAAHRQRIEALLAGVPDGHDGFLLNNLQGGPASCGCGNLLCRWATDYHVPATGTRLRGDDAPARFLAAVKRLAGAAPVIPVWTTECEDEDLPAKQRAGGKSTGLCGSVGCATGLCPKEFAKQWAALLAVHDGPVGVLALSRALEREQSGAGERWLDQTLAYLESIPPRHNGAKLPRSRAWVVIEGGGDAAARRRAAQSGAGAVIVARVKLDQSYEPRLVPVK